MGFANLQSVALMPSQSHSIRGYKERFSYMGIIGVYWFLIPIFGEPISKDGYVKSFRNQR